MNATLGRGVCVVEVFFEEALPYPFDPADLFQRSRVPWTPFDHLSEQRETNRSHMPVDSDL